MGQSIGSEEDVDAALSFCKDHTSAADEMKKASSVRFCLLGMVRNNVPITQFKLRHVSNALL